METKRKVERKKVESKKYNMITYNNKNKKQSGPEKKYRCKDRNKNFRFMPILFAWQSFFDPSKINERNLQKKRGTAIILKVSRFISLVYKL